MLNSDLWHEKKLVKNLINFENPYSPFQIYSIHIYMLISFQHGSYVNESHNYWFSFLIWQWCCTSRETRLRGAEKYPDHENQCRQEPAEGHRRPYPQAAVRVTGQHPGQWGTYQHPQWFQGQYNCLTLNKIHIFLGLSLIFKHLKRRFSKKTKIL